MRVSLVRRDLRQITRGGICTLYLAWPWPRNWSGDRAEIIAALLVPTPLG